MDRDATESWAHCRKNTLSKSTNVRQATSSLCRSCHTKYMGRRDITDSQFRRMRDSFHENKADITKLSDPRFVQMVKYFFYQLQEERVGR